MKVMGQEAHRLDPGTTQGTSFSRASGLLGPGLGHMCAWTAGSPQQPYGRRIGGWMEGSPWFRSPGHDFQDLGVLKGLCPQGTNYFAAPDLSSACASRKVT